VVADEVGKLAHESTEAAAKTNVIIQASIEKLSNMLHDLASRFKLR